MTIAAVAGASGYAGGELLRLLANHTNFEIGPIAAGGKAGQTLGQVHPQLAPLADRFLEEAKPELLAQADIVFCALPHGASAALVAQLPAELPVVDLGADFRLGSSQAWGTFYGGEHAGTWTYGLPELNRAQIVGQTRVANPGCYPTSVALGLAPLFAAGLLEPSDVVVVAASGTSGAGRKASEALLGSEVMGSMSAYKVGGIHQHTPEMEQTLSAAAGEPVSLSFTPLLAPMSRGILATLTAKTKRGVSEVELRAALAAAYLNEPFVFLLPTGAQPSTQAVYGSNAAQLQVTYDEHIGRVVVTSVIDNLVKGAAGQALQNANIMFGFDETTGLSSIGVAP